MFGSHKAVLALRSPVFRPLAETGQVIKFRKTSMFAFNEMVRYMHGAEMGWGPCDIDLEELFKMVDLAERCDLPGLSDIILGCARTSIIKKEKVYSTRKHSKTNLY